MEGPGEAAWAEVVAWSAAFAGLRPMAEGLKLRNCRRHDAPSGVTEDLGCGVRPNGLTGATFSLTGRGNAHAHTEYAK